MEDHRQPRRHLRDRLDFAGFAQEFLRRSPAYRRAYRRIARISQAPASLGEQEEMARQWALSFSSRS